MMEGISQEACSLAGHWGLGKLIAIYDDNSITIDGKTDVTFTEDTMKRFEGLGWHTLHVEKGNTDLDAMRKAIEQAQARTRACALHMRKCRCLQHCLCCCAPMSCTSAVLRL